MGSRPKPVRAPRVAGGSLRLAAWLAEGRLTGGLLAGKLLRSAGIFELRAAEVDEPHPVHPPGLPPSAAPGAAEPAAPDPDGVLQRLVEPRGPGFRFETAADFAEAYRAGRSTPEAVAERVLEEIGRAHV